MVKNFGGNKSKGFARKSFAKKEHALRVSEDDAEVYAQVTKIYGGSVCQVLCIDGTDMICHIRGKFRGRGKRDNLISNGTWLLVGKREWEKEVKGKLLNCDVIEVYNDGDKIKLKNNLTSVNWSPFVTNDLRIVGSSDDITDDLGIVFADEKTLEYQSIIETQITENSAGKSSIITTDDGEIIDIDDI